MVDGFRGDGYSFLDDDEFSTFVSGRDLSDAGYLVESLLAGRAEFVAEPGLVVSDIEADAEVFEADLAIVERMGADVPTSRVGGTADVPIALRVAVQDGRLGDPAKRWLPPRERSYDDRTSSPWRWRCPTGI